jgi:CHASE3 domain sensor protein
VTATNRQNGKTNQPDVPALRSEIAETRQQLGETVEALAAKADVKARAQESVQQAKVRAKQEAANAVVAARESAQQAANSAAQFGRELKADPATKLKVTADRVRVSVREKPAPWAVAAGALLLMLLIAQRRWRR